MNFHNASPSLKTQNFSPKVSLFYTAIKFLTLLPTAFQNISKLWKFRNSLLSEVEEWRRNLPHVAPLDRNYLRTISKSLNTILLIRLLFSNRGYPLSLKTTITFRPPHNSAKLLNTSLSLLVATSNLFYSPSLATISLDEKSMVEIPFSLSPCPVPTALIYQCEKVKFNGS